MNQEQRDTLKVRLVDAALKGYHFRMSTQLGINTLFLIGDNSFWTVTKHAVPMDHGWYATADLPLKEALTMIDRHWAEMQVELKTLSELDHWIPWRKQA